MSLLETSSLMFTVFETPCISELPLRAGLKNVCTCVSCDDNGSGSVCNAQDWQHNQAVLISSSHPWGHSQVHCQPEDHLHVFSIM